MSVTEAEKAVIKTKILTREDVTICAREFVERFVKYSEYTEFYNFCMECYIENQKAVKNE